MQYLISFVKFIFSRAMLAFIGLVVLALVIWFVGPLLAVDGLRPLASVGVRVSLIVLLLAFAMLWLTSGPVSLAGVAALCLLIWHGGPLLSLGAQQPLAPVWVRVVVIGAIVLACAFYWLLKLWRLLRADPQAITKFFLDRSEKDKANDESREQLRSVAGVVQNAVAQLKSLRGTGGLRRIFEGKRYLYDLPWYMIIGSPSAGKTTALLNSGLQFPLARKMGGPAGGASFRNSVGTVNCDWWLSNDAVLIDTAGRYTTRDSDAVTDAMEWKGFLGLLRKHRPRAPINGAIVALNTAELLGMDEAQRIDHAGMVRDRLEELRQELGIRFPVYVIVTKVDLLSGFSEYFQSLTSEGRAQPWGFTLAYEGLKGRPRASAQDMAEGQGALRERLRAEFGLLKTRLDMGLRTRLNEEYDLERRHLLLGLPQEMQALVDPLVRMLDEIFLDSRFDDTQHHNPLRGVYFTSGAQAMNPVAADPGTLMQRLKRSLELAARAALRQKTASEKQGEGHGEEAASKDAQDGASKPAGEAPRGGQIITDADRGRLGFFLHDVLAKVIIAEAHLVRPNLRWELRFRLLRLMGHALAVVVFVWLASALMLSFENNRKYLAAVNQRAQALDGQVRALFAAPKPAGVPDMLNAARELPGYAGLDVTDPPGSFLYGLYSAPPVLEVAADTYAQLQDHTLLPAILRRVEAVLAQSVKDEDPKLAYETLRVYRLLHDRQRYMNGGAGDVRDWVLRDWEQNGSATDFGGRASMVGHVEALFSGRRAVQSASLPNEALVRRVQEFLDSNTSTQRVYERAKAVMASLAPQEFTLIRAVGPQAGTVFSRAQGLPLEKGVPGLFTYDGYHELFSKRLPEFVTRALEDDAWVMGRSAANGAGGKRNGAADAVGNSPLLADIRRQYLSEYATRWQEFLDSIRTVAADDKASSSLGFDLSVLRQLAAPDSPLSRLARAAARETTLSRPLLTRAPEDRSFFDKATDKLSEQSREIGKNLGIRPEERLEREIVDNRFAALREVVTGQPDIGSNASASAAAGGARPGLENISGLLNEFYTLLVVADTALSSGSLPPGGVEIGARLKMEAGKLPAPFREVLTALAVNGADKVTQGAAEILRKQAQAQLDRIMGLMAAQVSEPCRRGLEGRYPLVPGAEDASMEDFTLVFAAGGAADEFFTKYLEPFVDMSVRPWRYKSPDMLAAAAGDQGAVGGGAQPAATGPTLQGELLKLLVQSGPDLDAFYRARQIRDLFFRDAAGKKFGWKLDFKVMELEPSVTDLVIDIDGQGQRYAHGPVQAFTVSWPGPRGGSTAELTANPRISAPTSTLSTQGPWALFRLLDKGRIVSTATPGRVSAEFQFDGRKALLDVSTGSQPNPLNSDLFKGFRCPGRFT